MCKTFLGGIFEHIVQAVAGGLLCCTRTCSSVTGIMNDEVNRWVAQGLQETHGLLHGI